MNFQNVENAEDIFKRADKCKNIRALNNSKKLADKLNFLYQLIS